MPLSTATREHTYGAVAAAAAVVVVQQQQSTENHARPAGTVGGLGAARGVQFRVLGLEPPYVRAVPPPTPAHAYRDGVQLDRGG